MGWAALVSEAPPIVPKVILKVKRRNWEQRMRFALDTRRSENRNVNVMDVIKGPCFIESFYLHESPWLETSLMNLSPKGGQLLAFPLLHF